jgi:NitT/TauT family transport system substrate-binding protein
MISRRKFLSRTAAGAALAVAAPLSRPAIAQTRHVKLGLPWLPTGQYTYPYVAREIGAWRKRGLDVEVVRGAGSLAALQNLVSGQFDIAILGTPPTLVGIQRGLPLRVLGTIGYEHTLALVIPTDSPIKDPKDLVGHKVGQVPAAGDTPLFPIFLRRHGVDPNKVPIVALEAKILEQSLISRQVDAIPIYAVSSLPNLVVRKFPVRQWPYSSVGLKFYLTQIVTKAEFLDRNRQLVADVIDGLFEGIKYELLDPEKAIDLHLQANPEIATLDHGRELIEIGQSIFQVSVYSDNSRDHGLGYSQFSDLGAQGELIRATSTKDLPGDPPPVASYTTNEFVGRVTLSGAEWDGVRRRVKPYADLVGLTV